MQTFKCFLSISVWETEAALTGASLPGQIDVKKGVPVAMSRAGTVRLDLKQGVFHYAAQ